MKKLFLSILMLAFAAATFAGSNNQREMTPEKRLDATIQDQVAFPRFLIDQDGEHTAELNFTVNADGTINVKDIVTTEPELKQNLRFQARDFHVNTNGLDLSSTYKVVFRFNSVIN